MTDDELFKALDEKMKEIKENQYDDKYSDCNHHQLHAMELMLLRLILLADDIR